MGLPYSVMGWEPPTGSVASEQTAWISELSSWDPHSMTLPGAGGQQGPFSRSPHEDGPSEVPSCTETQRSELYVPRPC